MSKTIGDLIKETFGVEENSEINMKNLKLLLGTICDKLNLKDVIVEVPEENDNDAASGEIENAGTSEGDDDDDNDMHSTEDESVLEVIFGEESDIDETVNNMKLQIRIIQKRIRNFDSDLFKIKSLIHSFTETTNKEKIFKTSSEFIGFGLSQKFDTLEKEVIKLRSEFESIQVAFLDKVNELIKKTLKIEKSQKTLEEKLNEFIEDQKEKNFVEKKKCSFWKSIKKKFKKRENVDKFEHLCLYK